MTNGTPLALPTTPVYRYVQLDHSIKETRLAELLPGSYDDVIRLKMHCVSLNSTNGVRPENSGFTVGDLQKDLPDDWVVRETINGRFIFERKKDYKPDEPYVTSWEHPKAKFEPVPNNYNLLHTKPQYEALSHVWGSEDDQTIIYIEATSSTSEHHMNSDSIRSSHGEDVSSGSSKRGAEDDTTCPRLKRSKISDIPDVALADYDGTTRRCSSHDPDTSVSCLSIQSGLAIALRHLRHKSRPRMLWADNICINQNDITERSHLVRHMGQIYRLAQKVIVWIGPEYDNSKLAMSKLEYLGRQVEITNKGSWRVNAPGCLEQNWSRTAVPLPYDAETWEAITKLLQRPWFKRLWVWQEAKLSSDESILQCGHKSMELYRFGAAAWCAASKFSTIPPGLMQPLFRAGDAVLRQFDEPFLHTVLQLNGKQCRDPRDKIYGALGLAPPQVADKIVPDYNKTTEEVYTDAMVALSDATARVDFLLACDLANRTLPGPTWAPDWSVAQRLSPRWLLSTTLASSISVSTAEVTNMPKPTLLVQGVECGTISLVGVRAPGHGGDLESLEKAIRSWAPKLVCLESQPYITKKENLLDAFVKTVHWNTLRERCPLDHGTSTLEDAKEAVKEILCASQDLKTGCSLHDPAKSSYKSRYREALGRVYIELNSGYIGMTSVEAEELDIVCVILGCPLPMILRPHSSGRYQVVGPAYIHGLMDAESVLGPLPQDIVVQVGASSGWYGGYMFRNLATNETFGEDPRLGEVPSAWVRIKAERTSTDPLHFVRFRDMATGKTINGDPRLLPRNLRARGVPLKPLKLV